MVGILRILLVALPIIAQSIFIYVTLENIFYAVIGSLPALFWLTFFLAEDTKRPEPKKIISYVFIAGALSALFSLIIQLIMRAYLVPEYMGLNSPALLLIFAAIEEVSKFYLVYLAIHKSKYFDEPVDGMIYMITGAMGFAAFENILFIMGSPDIAGILIFRFVGAILLHAIASGLIGFYWLHGQLFVGLIIGTLLHFFFNIVILSFDYGILLAPLLLVIISPFLFRDFQISKLEAERK